MNQIRKFLLTICMISLLTATALADDCHQLSQQWFGADGNDGSALELQSLNPEQPEIDAVLDDFFAAREADFIAAPVIAGTRNSMQPTGTSRSALVADLEERIHSVITDAQVSSFITELQETDNGYVATVYEWTFFDYDDLSDGTGGSDTAGFGTMHLVTLAYNDTGELEIVSDEYTESEVLTGVMSDPTSEDLIAETESSDNNTRLAVSFDEDFDPVKASIYANKWVSHENEDELIDSSYYNTEEYKNWNHGGGDCANYASQCLYAGNFTTGRTWYKDSKAWIACPQQFAFLKNYGTVVYDPTEEDVYPGAPLYFGSKKSTDYLWYYHVIICTGHNSAGTPVINGHNYDRYRVPWNYSTATICSLVQLTDYEIEAMTFEEDNIIAVEDVNVPLYGFYLDSTPSQSLQLTRGDTYPVITGFVLEDVQWAAVDYEGTTLYAKIEDGIYLESKAPPISIAATDSVTTNDYLTVTASVFEAELSTAVLELTDAAGNKQTVPMTIDQGIGTATVDCQDFAPGTLRVAVSGSTSMWDELAGAVDVDVVDVSIVSCYDGDLLLWQLDKATGILTIYEPVDTADWIRFGDKIKTVHVTRKPTELPENAFEGCAVTTVYGPQSFLTDMATAVGAEHIATGYFLDVLPSHWAFADINAAFEAGMIQGVTTYTFAPDKVMTRGMFVTVLGRIAGVDEDAYTTTPFEDVPANEYYRSFVGWAVENNIVTGKSNTIFAPDEAITREQAITIIVRYLKAFDMTLPDAQNPSPEFPDMDQVSLYAVEHVEWGRIKGIIRGHDTGCFTPQNTLTRAQATTMLLRMKNSAVDIDEGQIDETLQTMLAEKTASYNGEWSVYVKHLDSGSIASVKEEPFAAASLIKLFIAGAYCEAVEKGEIQDSYRADLKVMLTHSNNSSTNTIITELGNGNATAGMAKVNAFAATLGAEDSVLNRKMLASGTENYTSSKDCAIFLEALLNGEVVSPAVSEELLGYLEDQYWTNMIPAGVPYGTRTANKTGDLTHVTNDAAIIWAPEGTYILCVMSSGWNNANVARSHVVEISKMVYNYLNSDA